MKRIFTSKWFWIAIAVLVLGALVFLYFFDGEVFRAALWVVLIVGALWAAAEFALRAWKKRQRKTFDEGLTAKEGIEDRKREWESFQAELEKQKIDRYELPFYLLVGEPQSGKSVLLQNSDLHFPFGQNKLSGIGGTRGCDWWFAEEAVILDLAGRLFTHEGGVADQLEWEAFLDLLANFRPICPANGILLVIPCDSLLTDSTDVARGKANKIQAALLTLAKKLDAQLPIYVVLTKADKIFGFAECVHRLDAAKRHEMFGWSREAEKVDAPFDLEEVRAGFHEMVARARILRGEMTATASIPEAIGELDRMFAFPDELAALEEPLELYLRRVFADSGLADRLTFRGLYLTSGLQSGVPIARVCAQALGGGGDADNQELDALFTKQRAYFIKDLVRARVFAERGIVRPTKGRVIAAQRRAIVGYGVSAVIALISVIGSLVYLLGSTSVDVDRLTARALELSEQSARREDASLRDVLEVLSAIHEAESEERTTYEEAGTSTRDDLRKLYVAEFDTRLIPALRRAMAPKLEIQISGKGPASFDDLELTAKSCLLLLGEGKNFAEGRTLDCAKWALRQEEREWSDGSRPAFKLERAVELRKDFSGEAAVCPPDTAMQRTLEQLSARTLELVKDCLTPGRPYQPVNDLGFMITWKGMLELHRQLNAPTVMAEPRIFELAESYAAAMDRYQACTKVLQPKGQDTWEVERVNIEASLRGPMGVKATHDALVDLLASRRGIDSPDRNWAAADALAAFVGEKLGSATQDIDKSGVLEGDLKGAAGAVGEALKASALAEVDVPTPELRAVLDRDLARLCRQAPGADWKLETLGAEVAVGIESLSGSDAGQNTYLAKLRAVGEAFAKRYPTWKSVLDERAAAGAPANPRTMPKDLVLALVRARDAMATLRGESKPLLHKRINALLTEHVNQLAQNWDLLETPPTAELAPAVDGDVLDTLAAIAGAPNSGGPSADAPLAAAVQGLTDKYLEERQRAMLDHWRTLPPEGDKTLLILQGLDDHLNLMRARFATPDRKDEDRIDATWLHEVETVLVKRFNAHRDAALKYWEAGSLRDRTLDMAAQTVVQRLRADKFDEKWKGAQDAVKEPPYAQALLRPGAKIYARLPKAGEALEAARKLRSPESVRAVLGTTYAEFLSVTAESLSKPSDADGPTLVKKALDWDQGVETETASGGSAGDHYLRSLSNALRERVVDAAREKYREALADLFDEYSPTIDKLLTTKYEDTLGWEDEREMTRLSELLDRGTGKLEKLERQYKTSEPTLGLVPKELSADPSQSVWPLREFLLKLQTFFLGEKGKKIQEAKITFQIRPITEDRGTIWDKSPANVGHRPFFYAPSDTQGGWKYLEPPKEFDLAWDFRGDNAKRLRMRWNDVPNAAKSPEPGDAYVEISGSLAPLILAWSGEQQEDENVWRVSAEIKGSKLRAGFEVKVDRDRPLPKPPERRE